MEAKKLIFDAFMLFGGLALFLLGMNMMTEGLKKAFGAKLQRLLSKTTKNIFAGLGLGTALGAAIHSGPTIVMLLGFVNAGLMTLEQSIAPMMGANIGTTLSMQAVSFHINDYCYVAIACGLILSLAIPGGKGKDLGRTLLGFGLIFLGMNNMSAAISPYKETLSIYFREINGDTYGGVIIGVLVSLTLTAIWQSSGATIAIVFALVNAGVFTHFSQVFPIVIGSHIGTCTTALLSSLGTNIEARRTALSHLFFNIFNVALGVAMFPLYYMVFPTNYATPADLVRATANLHTVIMVVATVIVLPFSYKFAHLVRFIAKSNKPLPESSHLDYKLIEYPESAIVAVINELQRVTKVCSESLYLTAHVILNKFDRSTISQIKMNEHVVDDIKLAMREYLWSMTKKYLSRRQIIMSHHLNRCMIDLERVGDHIDQLCDLSLNCPDGIIDKESFDKLFVLYEKANKILSLVVESLSPDHEEFQCSAMHILEARDEYVQCSIDTKNSFLKKVESHEVSSIGALYYNEYISVLDRMMRHVKSIALAQKNEDFWIKRSKLDKRPKPLNELPVCEAPDAQDYLDKLKNEDYL